MKASFRAALYKRSLEEYCLGKKNMARESVNFEVFYTADALAQLTADWGDKKFGRVKQGLYGRIHHYEQTGMIAKDDSPLRLLRGNVQMLAAEHGRRFPPPKPRTQY